MLPALLRGGAETQAIDLINGIDGRYFEKYLLVFEKELDQLERVDMGSVKFHHVIRKGKFDFSFVRKISKLIDINKIEVIHCTMQISLLFAWLACRLSKQKPELVVAIHTTVNVNKKNEIIDQLVYRQLFRSCKKLIFVCQTQKNYWLSKYTELSNKSEVVYNGVDTEYFNPEKFVNEGLLLKKELNIADNNPVIVCIAGFRREKAHDILLQAFSQLPSNVHLVLAGDGLLRGEIESTIKQLDLSNRVHLLGNVNDVRPVLSVADISVLASVAVETFSIAMLESMSMKVPFISSDIGGLAEAIDVGETGDLVPVGDVESLKITLMKYLLDKEKLKLMGENSRNRVDSMFSKLKMVSDTEKILENVVRFRSRTTVSE